MSVLSYKNNKVKFDSFVVEPSDTVSKDLYETSAAQIVDRNKYYGASVYMCADCIKRFEMLKEADMKTEADIPEYDPKDEYALICCVDGCFNPGAVDVWLRSEYCELI